MTFKLHVFDKLWLRYLTNKNELFYFLPQGLTPYNQMTIFHFDILYISETFFNSTMEPGERNAELISTIYEKLRKLNDIRGLHNMLLPHTFSFMQNISNC